MHRRYGQVLTIVLISLMLGSCASMPHTDWCGDLPPLYGTDC